MIVRKIFVGARDVGRNELEFDDFKKSLREIYASFSKPSLFLSSFSNEKRLFFFSVVERKFFSLYNIGV